MRHLNHRWAVLGIVGGLVLATPAVAAAGRAGEPRTASTECVVEHVDGRGRVTGTSAEREGAVYGQFRCGGGQWVLAWSPDGRGDTVTASEIQVDPAGAVSAQRLVGPALSRDLTMAEMAAFAEATTGSGRAVIERAIVAVDDGRRRTPAEIDALLAGQDTTGVRVLGIVDQPDAAMSTNDLIDAAGGRPGSTVVYFSIWGALKGFFEWVVDTLEDTVEFIDRYCRLQFTLNGLELVCRF